MADTSQATTSENSPGPSASSSPGSSQVTVPRGAPESKVTVTINGREQEVTIRAGLAGGGRGPSAYDAKGNSIPCATKGGIKRGDPQTLDFDLSPAAQAQRAAENENTTNLNSKWHESPAAKQGGRGYSSSRSVQSSQSQTVDESEKGAMAALAREEARSQSLLGKLSSLIEQKIEALVDIFSGNKMSESPQAERERLQKAYQQKGSVGGRSRMHQEAVAAGGQDPYARVQSQGVGSKQRQAALGRTA